MPQKETSHTVAALRNIFTAVCRQRRNMRDIEGPCVISGWAKHNLGLAGTNSASCQAGYVTSTHSSSGSSHVPRVLSGTAWLQGLCPRLRLCWAVCLTSLCLQGKWGIISTLSGLQRKAKTHKTHSQCLAHLNYWMLHALACRSHFSLLNGILLPF